jgi:chaperonin GroES
MENIMKLQPLGDRVLVKLQPSEEKTSSGIIIPAAAQEKTTQGEVVAVGDSKDILIKPGQKVMYDKYAGSSVKMDNQEYLIVSYKDILAVVE